MRKHLLIICCIVLLGCSKNEPILPEPVSEAAITHITNDDLDLIDGAIQLTITKEEAIKRGVSASEYDLVAETLVKHNKGRAQTKSMNSILAWGTLFYEVGNPDTISYNVNQASHYYLEADSMTLYYTFNNYNSNNTSCNYLYYGLNSPVSLANCVFGWENSQGYTPLWNFTGSWITLEYIIEGMGNGVCVYEIRDEGGFNK